MIQALVNSLAVVGFFAAVLVLYVLGIIVWRSVVVLRRMNARSWDRTSPQALAGVYGSDSAATESTPIHDALVEQERVVAEAMATLDADLAEGGQR